MEFDHSYAPSFNCYSAMLLYLLMFHWNIRTLMIVLYCLVLALFWRFVSSTPTAKIFPFSLSIENGIKAQYNLSFMGHCTDGNKLAKYHSYIKPDNHYCLKVNVTKSTPFKLLREIPWEISFLGKYLFHLY